MNGQMIMKRFHTESFKEALDEKYRLKEEFEGAVVVRIVKSPYQGYDILVIDKELYVDLMSAHYLDGMPLVFPSKDCSFNEYSG